MVLVFDSMDYAPFRTLPKIKQTLIERSINDNIDSSIVKIFMKKIHIYYSLIVPYSENKSENK